MSRKGVPTQKTVAFRAQMEMGGVLVAALKPVTKMTLNQVGEKLGLSATMVSRIERQALVKVALAMRAHARKLEHSI